MKPAMEHTEKSSNNGRIKTFMLRKLEAAKQKLNHVPYITSNHKKMAVWSDIKEVLFISCMNMKCTVVLNALKHQLNYPASETRMHACTQTEQLLFLRQFIIVTPGTLLVDLNFLKNSETLMKLHDMVSVKHQKSREINTQQCNNMAKYRDTYGDGIARQPNVSGKLVPAVRRTWCGNIASAEIGQNSDDVKEKSDSKKKTKEAELKKHTLPRITAVLPLSSISEENSSAYIPLALLKDVCPEYLSILEEVAHSYIRRGSKASDISQYSAEEGRHLNSFLALHKGYGKPWFCLTSLSLMMSWSEFWKLCSNGEDTRWLLATKNIFLCILNVQKPDLVKPEKAPRDALKVEQNINDVPSEAEHIAGKANINSVSVSSSSDAIYCSEVKKSQSINDRLDRNAGQGGNKEHHQQPKCKAKGNSEVCIKASSARGKKMHSVVTTYLNTNKGSSKKSKVHHGRTTKHSSKKKTPISKSVSTEHVLSVSLNDSAITNKNKSERIKVDTKTANSSLNQICEIPNMKTEKEELDKTGLHTKNKVILNSSNKDFQKKTKPKKNSKALKFFKANNEMLLGECQKNKTKVKETKSDLCYSDSISSMTRKHVVKGSSESTLVMSAKADKKVKCTSNTGANSSHHKEKNTDLKQSSSKNSDKQLQETDINKDYKSKSSALHSGLSRENVEEKVRLKTCLRLQKDRNNSAKLEDLDCKNKNKKHGMFRQKVNTIQPRHTEHNTNNNVKSYLNLLAKDQKHKCQTVNEARKQQMSKKDLAVTNKNTINIGQTIESEMKDQTSSESPVKRTTLNIFLPSDKEPEPKTDEKDTDDKQSARNTAVLSDKAKRHSAQVNRPVPTVVSICNRPNTADSNLSDSRSSCRSAVTRVTHNGIVPAAYYSIPRPNLLLKTSHTNTSSISSTVPDSLHSSHSGDYKSLFVDKTCYNVVGGKLDGLGGNKQDSELRQSVEKNPMDEKLDAEEIENSQGSVDNGSARLTPAGKNQPISNAVMNRVKMLQKTYGDMCKQKKETKYNEKTDDKTNLSAFKYQHSKPEMVNTKPNVDSKKILRRNEKIIPKDTFQAALKPSKPKQYQEEFRGNGKDSAAVTSSNFGSSTSCTRDIYDAYARKQKPKPSKPDVHQPRKYQLNNTNQSITCDNLATEKKMTAFEEKHSETTAFDLAGREEEIFFQSKVNKNDSDESQKDSIMISQCEELFKKFMTLYESKKTSNEESKDPIKPSADCKNCFLCQAETSKEAEDSILNQLAYHMFERMKCLKIEENRCTDCIAAKSNLTACLKRPNSAMSSDLTASLNRTESRMSHVAESEILHDSKDAQNTSSNSIKLSLLDQISSFAESSYGMESEQCKKDEHLSSFRESQSPTLESSVGKVIQEGAVEVCNQSKKNEKSDFLIKCKEFFIPIDKPVYYRLSAKGPYISLKENPTIPSNAELFYSDSSKRLQQYIETEKAEKHVKSSETLLKMGLDVSAQQISSPKSAEKINDTRCSHSSIAEQVRNEPEKTYERVNLAVSDKELTLNLVGSELDTNLRETAFSSVNEPSLTKKVEQSNLPINKRTEQSKLSMNKRMEQSRDKNNAVGNIIVKKKQGIGEKKPGSEQSFESNKTLDSSQVTHETKHKFSVKVIGRAGTKILQGSKESIYDPNYTTETESKPSEPLSIKSASSYSAANECDENSQNVLDRKLRTRSAKLNEDRISNQIRERNKRFIARQRRIANGNVVAAVTNVAKDFHVAVPEDGNLSPKGKRRQQKLRDYVQSGSKSSNQGKWKRKIKSAPLSRYGRSSALNSKNEYVDIIQRTTSISRIQTHGNHIPAAETGKQIRSELGRESIETDCLGEMNLNNNVSVHSSAQNEDSNFENVFKETKCKIETKHLACDEKSSGKESQDENRTDIHALNLSDLDQDIFGVEIETDETGDWELPLEYNTDEITFIITHTDGTQLIVSNKHPDFENIMKFIDEQKRNLGDESITIEAEISINSEAGVSEENSFEKPLLALNSTEDRDLEYCQDRYVKQEEVSSPNHINFINSVNSTDGNTIKDWQKSDNLKRQTNEHTNLCSIFRNIVSEELLTQCFTDESNTDHVGFGGISDIPRKNCKHHDNLFDAFAADNIDMSERDNLLFEGDIDFSYENVKLLNLPGSGFNSRDKFFVQDHGAVENKMPGTAFVANAAEDKKKFENKKEVPLEEHYFPTAINVNKLVPVDDVQCMSYDDMAITSLIEHHNFDDSSTSSKILAPYTENSEVDIKNEVCFTSEMLGLNGAANKMEENLDSQYSLTLSDMKLNLRKEQIDDNDNDKESITGVQTSSWKLIEHALDENTNLTKVAEKSDGLGDEISHGDASVKEDNALDFHVSETSMSDPDYILYDDHVSTNDDLFSSDENEILKIPEQKETQKHRKRRTSKNIKESAKIVHKNAINSDPSKENTLVSNSKTASVRIKKIDSNGSLGNKHKLRGRRKATALVNEEDFEEEEEETKRREKEAQIAAEGFIKTQQKYMEIIMNNSLEVAKGNGGNVDNNSTIQRSVSDTSSEFVIEDMPEGIPVHGDRQCSKVADHMAKASSSGHNNDSDNNSDDDDDDDDDDEVWIDDPSNNCRYQLIDDEDGVNLGGLAFYKEYVFPYVYINGYKYTPLKDALQCFKICLPACTIPRSVLSQHKGLVKSLGTWDQVYKLELIKMKEGPALKTGDTLVKLDALLVLLPELTKEVVERHKNTNLKRSKNCNISLYQVQMY